MAAKRLSPTSARHRLLLVVDSDARNLSYTARLLERLHYYIWTAKSAQEAIEMAATAIPALIITSHRLKDMAGLKFIRRLKQIDRTRSVPMIVIGQESDSLDEQQCLAAGAATYLTKPVKAEDLYRVIQVAIEPVPRMNIRISASLPVIVHNRTAQTCRTMRVTALSEYGAFICTPDPYPRNTKLLLIIHLAEKAIAADAVVIYNNRVDVDRRERGMGVQFVQISDQDRELIRKFIRAEIRKYMESQ